MQVHARRDRLLVIAAFVVLAAIAVGIAYWAWQQQALSIRRDADRNLVAVSRLKAEQVSAWLAERRADAETVRADRLLANGVADLLGGGAGAQLERDVGARLKSLAELYHYEDIVLVRPDGSVVMREPSTASHDMGAVVEEKVREAVRSGAVEATGLYRSEDGDVRLEMVAPVLDDAGRAIAAVVLHTDPGHRLFPLIQTWPIGGKTSGETVLVERRGDEVLFLNDLRFHDDAALQLALPADSPDLPAARAARGEHGIVAGIDYRGVPVLAAAQPVPGSPWSVVAKVDESEVLGPISRRALLTAGFTLLIVVLAAAATLLLWRAREARADAETVASELRYRALFENMTEGVALHELVRDGSGAVADYRIVDINPAFSAHTGLPADQVEGRLATEAYGTSRAPYLEEYAHATDGQPQHLETHFEELDKDFSISAIGQGGDSFATIFEDVTERRRAEQQLRASEDRFRYVFDNALLGISLTSPDGRVDVNRAFCDMLGYTREEMAHMRWQDLTPPEDAASTQDKLDAVLRGDIGSTRFVKRYVRKDGGIVWAEVSTTLRRDADGEPEYFVTAVLDISELVAASDEVRRLNRDLEQRVEERTEELDTANKELEAFAYSVSHDLRAPLRHISGFSTLLADRAAGDLDEKSRHYVEVINRSVNEMGVLIDDLLQFSRTGRAELTIEPVDMDVVIQEALAPLRHETASRELDWSIKPVPQASADRALIRQVWANLLGNAVKYTRPVTPARIEVGARVTDGEVVYSVTDNGVGFDMEYAHKLFGVFQRLHDASEFEGTGIGLANVHRIVTRLHGKVWAEGELGKGATFSFSLPIAKEPK